MDFPRNTKQREVILTELRKLTTHPTADELYIIVKKYLPKISIATVYRNLESMADKGIVKRVEISGKQRRYDGRTDPHFHIQCKICGRIEDIEITDISKLELEIKKIIKSKSGFIFSDYIIDFFGICEKCQKSN